MYWLYYIVIYSSILALVICLTILADLVHRYHVCRHQELSMNKISTRNWWIFKTAVRPGRIWLELLTCFHLPTNYKHLMQLNNDNKSNESEKKLPQKRKYFALMTGMRTIICLWITVFHVYYYSLYAMSNTPFIIAKLENLILQPIIQSCFYVDVFFIMR